MTILNGLSNIGEWEVVVLDMESLATLNGVVHSAARRHGSTVDARICEASYVWLDIEELPICGGQIRAYGRDRVALRAGAVYS